MDEKRQFFRIHNNGSIHASCDGHPLEVIEISSSGVAIIKEDTHIQNKGKIDLQIEESHLKINYEVLRVEEKTMVLVFKKKSDVEKLFLILKRLKDKH